MVADRCCERKIKPALDAPKKRRNLLIELLCASFNYPINQSDSAGTFAGSTYISKLTQISRGFGQIRLRSHFLGQTLLTVTIAVGHRSWFGFGASAHAAYSTANEARREMSDPLLS